MTRSLLLALALLFPGSALADGEEGEEPSNTESAEAETADLEAVTASSAVRRGPTKKTKEPTATEQLHQLRGERTEILDELGALEEGYSDLVNHDARALEARVDGLLSRLRQVDERIATLAKTP